MTWNEREAEEIYNGIFDKSDDEIIEQLRNIIYEPYEDNEILIWLVLKLVAKIRENVSSLQNNV